MDNNFLILGKFSQRCAGGIEQVNRLWISTLKRINHDVTINHICFEKSKNKNIVFADVAKEDLICQPIINVMGQPFSLKYIIMGIVKARVSDVILLHAPNLLAIVPAIIGKIIFKKNLVVFWHADILGKPPFIQKLANAFNDYLLKVSDNIILSSDIYAKYSPALTSYLDKMHVIPIPVSDDQVRATKKKINNKYILSVGRLVEYKGFELAIRALLRSQTNYELVIIGSGPLELKLRQLVKQLGCDNRVHILTTIDADDLRNYLAHAEAVLLASNTRAEAYGIVLVEGLMFGKPLISSDVKGSGMSYINLHLQTGLVFRNNDVEDLARCISFLHEEPSLMKKLGEQARERYESEFKVVKLEENLNNLLMKFHEDPSR
jgi:glycosyltransferase involved in cell wall biosynthesis